MWQGHYQTTTDVPADQLFRAISDINHWSRWDDGLASTTLAGAAVPGAIFTLKPKGGPPVQITIDAIQPYRLVDTAHLFLAKMRTTHDYAPCGPQTRIRFSVEVWGLLGFFWRRVIGEHQIKDAPAQIAAFVRYARAHP